MSVVIREAKRLAALAAPMALTQVGLMLLGVVDTVMVGRLGVEAIGAASLGSLWVFGTLFVASGLVYGIDPVVAQAHGAGDGPRCGRALQTAFALCLVLTPPLAVAWVYTAEALVFFGQTPSIAEEAARYAQVQIPAIPFALGFIALRQYLQGRGITTPGVVVAVLANLVNAALNAVLIYGVAPLGIEGRGVVGAGIATGITRAFLFLALLAYVRRARLHVGAWAPWSLHNARGAALLELLRPGVPVALQLGLEAWAFQIGTLLAGRLGPVPLAAHTIVLNAASFSFMLPLGVSLGTVTRVGNLVGAGEHRLAQLVAHVALALGAAVMSLSALVFIVLRSELPRIYTSDPETIALAAAVFPIAAAFQLFDGTQVVGGGVLRGMGDTRPAAIFNVVGFYALGLPIALWLSLRAGLGLAGIWWGFCLGLAVVAVLLVFWIWRRGPARRVSAPRSGGPAGALDIPASPPH